MLDITIVPILSDNYAYILQSGGVTGIVDPGEAAPIINKLKTMGITPSYIFNTHHHGDHIGGNEKLRQQYGCKIIAPKLDAGRIKDIDIAVDDGVEFRFGDESVKVISTPGHTANHVCFYFSSSNSLFTGDTLFSMGCGRVFEGTMNEMFSSLEKIKRLPPEIAVYCGHEYTQKNGEFCLSIDPDNTNSIERMAQVKALRALGMPTIPTSLALEKQTNIFLRCTDAKQFAHYRQLKDSF